MTNYALPEARQIAADLAGIAEAAGTAATIRRYVSETASATPWLGTRATPTIQERRVRLISLRPATMREIAEAGGRLLDGDMIALLPSQAPGDLSARDHIAIEGAEWQIASEPRPQSLYGQRFLSVILRRQGG